MLKSKTGLFFLISCLIPYAQELLQPHDSSFLLNFLAFVCLIISTGILVYRTRFSGRSVIYPLVAVGAVLLFLYTFEFFQHAGEYIAFKRQQPQLEKFVVELKRSPRPDSLLISVQDYPLPGIGGYSVLPDGTYLFTQGGQHSASFWGVAYSTTGKAPTRHDSPMHYWYQLEGHWYMWFRYDN
ncbi:hypothetical protein LGH70_13980 [Hymenobacter sp. BT635]|uniref:DUF4131 domain-containing protein n=1 Tax=Hymenobacter nitidus TaxID=2880929 RepID=A0ABS8AEK6_9BACT|nr:hypothetical protein [Hymenobacter nitidus]MCB2378706.1 hypothetical protein [Hymenobacter nitidus]